MPNAVVMTGFGDDITALLFSRGGQQAAEAHRQLEGGNVHERIILTLT
jgi:hypothetical protein